MSSDPRFVRPGLVPTELPPARPQHSPAERAFQVQLNRVDKLKTQLSDLEAWAQTHRVAMSERVHPLRAEHQAKLRQMALLIDERLAGKALGAMLRETAVGVLCGITRALAHNGDQEMARLHDRHAPVGLAAAKADKARAMRAQLEEALGGPIDDLPPGASDEDAVTVGMARLRERVAEEKEQRREKVERKKARKQPVAAQAKGTEDKADASALLRVLIRQLASVLHPDREADAQARDRKTALMGEANAAYARKDLVALLQLQQKASLIAAGSTASWAADKLAALTVLLKQQVADLERERAGRQEALTAEFEIPPGLGVTPRNLQAALFARVGELEEALRLMESDLESLGSDQGFKRWIKQQQVVAARLAAR